MRARQSPDSAPRTAAPATEASGRPEPDPGAFASTSIVRHLIRGAIGFGLIGAAVALTPNRGPVALLLVLPGMVALRGCPTCWIAGLIQTVSAGRLRRTCTDTGCKLSPLS